MTSPSAGDRSRHFSLVLTLIIGVYLFIEAAYILRFPLVMDEFGGAHDVYRMATLCPYRDYPPYKTVLGYYVQLPVLLLPFHTWTVLLLVKAEMAILTAAVFFAAAQLLRRAFSAHAVLAATAMLLAMSTFLERSAELRVDAMTGLAGLLSLVLLVRDRPAGSGVFAALSFLISQKGAFFPAATLGAVVLTLWLSNSDRREMRRFAVRFGTSLTLALAAYMAFWSALSSPVVVIRATFTSALHTAAMSDYDNVRLFSWLQTLLRNPVFYAFTVGAIVYLAIEAVRRHRRIDALLGGYGIVLLVQAMLYRQPFPYWFVVILPVTMVINACAIDRLISSPVWIRRKRAIIFAYLAGALLLPLTRLGLTLTRYNDFQRANVDLAERILGPDDRYLAAVDILFRRTQSIEDLRWIDRSRFAALARLPAADVAALTRNLDAAPTKLVIDNYRIGSLPLTLRTYLVSHFEHLWGNIFIYAPRVAPGKIALNFDGKYRVESDEPMVRIDLAAVHPGEMLSLSRGVHVYQGRGVMRLKLIPPGLPPGSPPSRDFFPDVYFF